MIVHVIIHVKPEFVSAFTAATIENAQNSLQEPGVTRFDLLQQQDNPDRFLLIEIYKSPEDAASHKETEHYKKWRDTVADMMAEPRRSEKFSLIYPSGSIPTK
jgi:(4S)-4-hydroxy-5-phosphonooxypentane-2,3-dione isomerase